MQKVKSVRVPAQEAYRGRLNFLSPKKVTLASQTELPP